MKNHNALLYSHIGLGIAILLITLFRLIARMRMNSNDLAAPTTLTQREWRFAKAGHILLYIFLIFTPVTGLLAFLYDGVFEEAHEVFIYAFTALIIGHVLFALKHIVIDKNNLLKRII